MQSIYERIEYLIRQKGMTKKAFCEELAISTGNMGDWKRGKSTPSTNKLIEIGEFFQVSLDWLILGKHSGQLVREQNGNYFFEPMGQLDCQLAELSQRERDFIEEYISFAKHRKEQGEPEAPEEEEDNEAD